MDVKYKKNIRKERRKDEQSLYYIIERDIDRNAIFPENDGWYPQVNFRKGCGIIDYIVKYGEALIGLELKSKFPTESDFTQIEKYCKFVDAIFLCYPSDWAAEALFISQSEKMREDVGIIAIAPFRSCYIRKATYIPRKDEKIWNEYFDKEGIIQSFKKDLEKNMHKKKTTKTMNLHRFIGMILKEKCFYTSLNKNLKKPPNEGLYKIKLEEKNWRTIALLYAIQESRSIFRCYSYANMESIRTELGWKGFDFGFFKYCGFISDYSYSTQEFLYSLSDEVLAQIGSLEKGIESSIGKIEWEKFCKKIKKWSEKHKKDHKKDAHDFLSNVPKKFDC